MSQTSWKSEWPGSIICLSSRPCAVIIAAGTSTRLVQQITKWDEQSKGITIIRKICGILVLLGGIYLVYYTF